MYAGSLVKYVVNIAGGKMIVDQYNPRDAGLFREKDKVASHDSSKCPCNEKGDPPYSDMKQRRKHA
jgi:hypothetical protein